MPDDFNEKPHRKLGKVTAADQPRGERSIFDDVASWVVASTMWTQSTSRCSRRTEGGARAAARRDALASQILDALYTVRNNAFHGGKRADGANDTAPRTGIAPSRDDR